MKHIAVIFAGGTGQRMHTKALPKQFLEVHGKPVLIYTLEQFERHPQIDGIVLVCLEGWIDYAEKLLKRFYITKAAKIVPGGTSGQDSIFRGLTVAREIWGEDDTAVLIHDGVRPMIDGDTISRCIASVEARGNAVTTVPAIETIFVRNGKEGQAGQIFRRSDCEMARAPQCFRLKDIYEAHRRAQDEGRDDFVDSASLMQYYGHTLFTVQGPMENIKITTPMDFYVFRALLDAKEDLQIMGV